MWGGGYVEIMAIMENAHLEFEVRHNVRDQATGQPVLLSGHFALLLPFLQSWTI